MLPARPLRATARWHEAPLLPGVARLIAHLKVHGVTLALATSTPRRTLERKLSTKQSIADAFLPHLSICGDEVDNGKPAPDCFVQLASRLGQPPAACLVIEDAPAGVAAAVAAGMRVVAVPSMLQKGGKPSEQVRGGVRWLCVTRGLSAGSRSVG